MGARGFRYIAWRQTAFDDMQRGIAAWWSDTNHPDDPDRHGDPHDCRSVAAIIPSSTASARPCASDRSCLELDGAGARRGVLDQEQSSVAVQKSASFWRRVRNADF